MRGMNLNPCILCMLEDTFLLGMAQMSIEHIYPRYSETSFLIILVLTFEQADVLIMCFKLMSGK